MGHTAAMQGVPRAEALRRADDWLARVGLKTFVHSYPHMMSGGQRKRVALGDIGNRSSGASSSLRTSYTSSSVASSGYGKPLDVPRAVAPATSRLDIWPRPA